MKKEKNIMANVYEIAQGFDTLWDEKKRLNRELVEVMAEKQNLQELVDRSCPKTIEISDPTVGKNVKFGGF